MKKMSWFIFGARRKNPLFIAPIFKYPRYTDTWFSMRNSKNLNNRIIGENSYQYIFCTFYGSTQRSLLNQFLVSDLFLYLEVIYLELDTYCNFVHDDIEDICQKMGFFTRFKANFISHFFREDQRFQYSKHAIAM